MSRHHHYRVYRYRWVVLAVFMLINIMVQVLWICYAPVASAAAGFYGVKRESIDLLANLFMLIYLPVSFPAAWAIDHYGFKKAVGAGTVLIAIFGLLRALFPFSYTAALIGSVGIAIGQPFLLNAFTKFAAVWFPQKNRATITGVLFLSEFLGIGLGEALGPVMLGAFHFKGMQMIYAGATALSAVLFLLFARAKPPTPAGPRNGEARALVLDGLKKMLRQREVYFLSLALFIASGIVNSMFMLIDGFGREKGLTTEQGITLTSALLVAGIAGAIVLPAFSDVLCRRKSIILAGILGALPATICLAMGRGFPLETAAFILLGFCITGVTPVAFQYGAEITHPAPEGTSNGIFALVIQASGILVLLMNTLKGVFHNSYIPSLICLGCMAGASGLLFILAEESPEMNQKLKVNS